MDEASSWRVTLTRRVGALVLVVALFGVTLLLSWGVSDLAGRLFTVGDPGTVSRLLVGVAALQVVGFGVGAVALLWTREQDWRSYLRLDEITVWTVFYGTATGLTLMVVASLATVAFIVLDLDPAESAVGTATDPVFYLVLFAVSTFVAVPMEELFFRGIVQRHLEEWVHPAVAIGVASLLFTYVHAGGTVEAGSQLVALGMFFSFGVVLGVGYYRTENLFVPIIGHALYNGIQVLLRTIEVLA
jgi:membrane protease YdiL (CAAX protease family)